MSRDGAMTGTVTGAFTELLVRGMRALRRSAAWWGFGIVVFAVVNAAFWPSLEGSDALDSFDDMADLLEAFGAQNLATPSGYLDGQMYALMLPLLLSGMAIAGLTAITSGDEGAGRLELLHALPVSRRAVWLGRWAAAMLVLFAVAADHGGRDGGVPPGLLARRGRRRPDHRCDVRRCAPRCLPRLGGLRGRRIRRLARARRPASPCSSSSSGT